jgi:polysaccharide deacetylase family protein (PEP-CTERM system associated)
MIPGSDNQASTGATAAVKNMLSFEVEDIFHAEGHDVESIEMKSRIIPNLIHLLDHLDEQKAVATFFVLGAVAKRFPEIVALMDARGHEVASHGWSHGDIRQMPPEKLVTELKRSRTILEDILQKPVYGFRAAAEYSGREYLSLYRRVAEAGYCYDCSPLSHPLPGRQNQPVTIGFKEGGSIIAVPPSVARKLGVSLRFSDRLRLFPGWFVRRAIHSLNRRGDPAMINMKLWELDHHQRRPPSADYVNYSRYGNLSLAEEKLMRLLDIFEFTSCAEVLKLTEGDSSP